MKIDIIKQEIDKILNSDLTMDDIREIPNIVCEIYDMFRRKIPSDAYPRQTGPSGYYSNHPVVKKIEKQRNDFINLFKQAIMVKLKEKLNYSDDVITSIVDLVFNHEEMGLLIDKIKILDDECVYMSCRVGKSQKSTSKTIGFYTLKKYRILNSNPINVIDVKLQEKLVNAINNRIKKDAITDDEYYYVHFEENPEYGYPRMRDSWMISVYLNRPLPKIVKEQPDGESLKQDDATMLITSYDDLYAYRIGYRNGDFEIREHEKPIIDLEQELSKEMQAEK